MESQTTKQVKTTEQRLEENENKILRVLLDNLSYNMELSQTNLSSISNCLDKLLGKEIDDGPENKVKCGSKGVIGTTGGDLGEFGDLLNKFLIINEKMTECRARLEKIV